MKWTQGEWAVHNANLENKKMHQRVGRMIIKNQVNPYDLYLASAAPDFYVAASGLLDFVMNKYGLSSSEELQCEHMRALSKAMDKARGEANGKIMY